MNTNSTPTRAGRSFAALLIAAGTLASCAPADHGLDQPGSGDLRGGAAMPDSLDAGTASVYFGSEYAQQERALSATPAEPQPQAF